MDSSWLKVGSGQKLLALTHDRRPAWLWGLDSDQAIWTNDSAQLASLALCEEVGCLHPIAGQVKRLLRLGSLNLTTQARIPFVSGSRPEAITCLCTPIELPNGSRALLMVGRDDIDQDHFAYRHALTPQEFAFLPANVSFVIADRDNRILGGAGPALELAQADSFEDSVAWEQDELAEGLFLFALTAEFDVESSLSENEGAAEIEGSTPIESDFSEEEFKDEGAADASDEEIETAEQALPLEAGLDEEFEAEQDDVRPSPSYASLETQVDVADRLNASAQHLDAARLAADGSNNHESDVVPATTPVEIAMPKGANAQIGTVMAKIGAEITKAASHVSTSRPETQLDDRDAISASTADPVERGGSLSDLISLIDSTSSLYLPLGPEDDELPKELAQLAQPPAAHLVDESDDVPISSAHLDDPEGAPQDVSEPTDVTDEEEIEVWRVTGLGPLRPVNAAGTETDASTGDVDTESSENIQDSQFPDSSSEFAPSPEHADATIYTGQGPYGLLASSGIVDDPDDQSIAASSSESEIEASHNERGEEDSEDSAADDAETDSEANAPELDQTARYNFDELGKILNERVNIDRNQTAQEKKAASEQQSRKVTAAAPLPLDNELVLLNRLPVGVLIFKDQNILFANRAFANMLGCETISAVRTLGLDRIFPQVADSKSDAGPILQLQNAQDEPVWVDARLQSISFQGESALVLTAHTATRDTRSRSDGLDAAERLAATFGVVSALAQTRNEGLAQLDAAGVIEEVNENGSRLIQHPERSIVGRPLALFIRQNDAERLSDHLAKAQDTEQNGQAQAAAALDSQILPLDLIGGAKAFVITLQGSEGPAHLALFAPAEKPHPGARQDYDPALLQRLGRGIRRPLNTIMGFSQMIEGEAFGAIENDRYRDYARDIVASGREIAGLIEELDDYARIEAGQYEPQGESVDLVELLEECETVVRHQASVRQVLLRSAIAENLPHIQADRTTLRKAMLNVLASAIDQTAPGGKVILAAQLEDDGSIGVHVRDSGTSKDEWADRFAVFREQAGNGTDAMIPLKSSMGLALTRSLFAINECELSFSPSSGTGSLITLNIPASIVVNS